jgi:cell pole-organizing protein PopZ
MEDILSSIRKYVAEEGAVKNEDSAEKERNTNDGNITGPGEEANIISLGADQVMGHEGPSLGQGPVFRPSPQVTDSLRYTEQSSLAEEVITIPKRPGPFDKLTDALKSYGKPKLKGDDKTEMEIVCNFFRSIAEERVDKWLENNMAEIVEEAILREIEKIKSEG